MLTLANCHLNLRIYGSRALTNCNLLLLRIYSTVPLLVTPRSANGVPPRVTVHAKRVRDRVEAGGGAVGARAGRLVLGVEDDVLGRLLQPRGEHVACAAPRSGTTTRATWLG